MLDTMMRLAHHAGTLALDHLTGARPLRIEEKGPLDLVTQADRDVEAFLHQELTGLFPEDGFFGEEGSRQTHPAGRTWVVDPIDGTTNFVRRNPNWAVSIGLYEAGQPRAGVIYAPAHDLMLAGSPASGATLNGKALAPLAPHWPANPVVAVEVSSQTPPAEQAYIVRFVTEAGCAIRLYGASTMAFMALARGFVDADVDLGAFSWDLMAGMAILEGLGAQVVTDRPLDDLSGPYKVLCGCEAITDAWLPLIGVER
jgi:myo-inositol-1(or 4)-monophosphatase